MRTGLWLGGAGSTVITPGGFEVPPESNVDGSALTISPAAGEPIDPAHWLDCGLDGLCPGDPGYTMPDEGEGDDEMQGMWLAGFGVGRPAAYCPESQLISQGCVGPSCCVSKFAHDHLKVQILVLRQGDTTVAFASIDTVGFFKHFVEDALGDVGEELGIDLFIMGATHNHEAPDTFGQWGPGASGYSPLFFATINAQTQAGLRQAINNLQPATIEAAVLDVGFDGLAVDDSRPPYIFDDNVPLMIVRNAISSNVIGTMLSFANHVEVLWSGNRLITSDYPHFVRTYIEQGLDAVTDPMGQELKPALPGLGGVTVFFAGAVGGLINPGRGGAKDYAGNEPAERHSFEAADAVGQQLASRVLEAVANNQVMPIANPTLRFARREFLSSGTNRVLLAGATILNWIDRPLYNAARVSVLNYEPDWPSVLTEVSVVRLGSLTFFSAPGEIFPETLTGGFPGKPRAQTPVVGATQSVRAPSTCDADGLPVPGGTMPCIVNMDQENPPDWTMTPDPPYVYDMVPGEMPFFIGLGMDALGYIVPPYDYEYNGFSQAPGSHYEETNGLGAGIHDHWKAALQECIDALATP